MLLRRLKFSLYAKFVKTVLPPVSMIVIGAIITYAQSATATLSGTVLDEKGLVIPGVEVTVANPDTRYEREVRTGDQGQFTIPLLPPGAYTVIVKKEGFRPL